MGWCGRPGRWSPGVGEGAMTTIMDDGDGCHKQARVSSELHGGARDMQGSWVEKLGGLAGGRRSSRQ